MRLMRATGEHFEGRLPNMTKGGKKKECLK